MKRSTKIVVGVVVPASVALLLVIAYILYQCRARRARSHPRILSFYHGCKKLPVQPADPPCELSGVVSGDGQEDLTAKYVPPSEDVTGHGFASEKSRDLPPGSHGKLKALLPPPQGKSGEPAMESSPSPPYPARTRQRRSTTRFLNGLGEGGSRSNAVKLAPQMDRFEARSPRLSKGKNLTERRMRIESVRSAALRELPEQNSVEDAISRSAAAAEEGLSASANAEWMDRLPRNLVRSKSSISLISSSDLQGCGVWGNDVADLAGAPGRDWSTFTALDSQSGPETTKFTGKESFMKSLSRKSSSSRFDFLTRDLACRIRPQVEQPEVTKSPTAGSDTNVYPKAGLSRLMKDDGILPPKSTTRTARPLKGLRGLANGRSGTVTSHDLSLITAPNTRAEVTPRRSLATTSTTLPRQFYGHRRGRSESIGSDERAGDKSLLNSAESALDIAPLSSNPRAGILASLPNSGDEVEDNGPKTLEMCGIMACPLELYGEKEALMIRKDLCNDVKSEDRALSLCNSSEDNAQTVVLSTDLDLPSGRNQIHSSGARQYSFVSQADRYSVNPMLVTESSSEPVEYRRIVTGGDALFRRDIDMSDTDIAMTPMTTAQDDLGDSWNLTSGSINFGWDKYMEDTSERIVRSPSPGPGLGAWLDDSTPLEYLSTQPPLPLTSPYHIQPGQDLDQAPPGKLEAVVSPSVKRRSDDELATDTGVNPWDLEFKPNPVIFPHLHVDGIEGARNRGAATSKEQHLRTLVETPEGHFSALLRAEERPASSLHHDTRFMDCPENTCESSTEASSSPASQDTCATTATPPSSTPSPQAIAVSGETENTCSHCGLTFSTAGLRNKHVNRKHVRRFICSVADCTSAFHLGADLKRHQINVHKAVHSNVKTWRCTKQGCSNPNVVFKRKDNYMRHLARCNGYYR